MRIIIDTRALGKTNLHMVHCTSERGRKYYKYIHTKKHEKYTAFGFDCLLEPQFDDRSN